MLEQKADVLGLQRLVVDLQLIEQPAQVRPHVTPRVAIRAAADAQHAVRRIGLQREIAAPEGALVRRLLALAVHIEREMRSLRRPIRHRDVMPLAVIRHEPVRRAEVRHPLALALAITCSPSMPNSPKCLSGAVVLPGRPLKSTGHSA